MDFLTCVPKICSGLELSQPASQRQILAQCWSCGRFFPLSSPAETSLSPLNCRRKFQGAAAPNRKSREQGWRATHSAGGKSQGDQVLLTMLTPPEFSALHIPSSGAIPMVVPLNVTPLQGYAKKNRDKTRDPEGLNRILFGLEAAELTATRCCDAGPNSHTISLKGKRS